MALASDFPRLWQDPKTAPRERKRMLRLLVDDVTLLKDRQITAHVRFRGGKTTTLTLPLPKSAWELRQTDAEVIREIDRLLDDHTDAEIAARLNENGRRSGCGKPFSHMAVTQLRYKYNLKSRYQRLRERGLLTLEEMALRLKVHHQTVKRWYHHGLLVAYAYNDKHECLYEPPGPDAPTKSQGRKLSDRRTIASVALDHTQEVQYEASALWRGVRGRLGLILKP